jgi:hypothetical protein
VCFLRLKLSELKLPIWTPIVPKVEEELVVLALKRLEFMDKVADQTQGNREAKNTITQKLNIKPVNSATNGGLENQSN